MFSLFFYRLFHLRARHGVSRDEAYLAEAADIGQLEARMRVLTRNQES